MAETIGKIVLCYDINSKHNQVKDSLKELGYSDRWKKISTNVTYDMPNTTVWHPTKTVSQATADIRRVCNNLGVVLERSFSALTGSEVDGYNQ